METSTEFNIYSKERRCKFMVYGIDTTSFNRLKEIVEKRHLELYLSPRAYEGILLEYVNTFECLLRLVRAIILACDENPKKDRYVSVFLPVYDQLQERILELLRAELSKWIKEGSVCIVEFVIHVIRDSQVTLELTDLDICLSQGEGRVDPDEHLDKATTVTEGVTKRISNHTNLQLVKASLRTLNDLMSTIKRAL